MCYNLCSPVGEWNSDRELVFGRFRHRVDEAGPLFGRIGQTGSFRIFEFLSQFKNLSDFTLVFF